MVDNSVRCKSVALGLWVQERYIQVVSSAIKPHAEIDSDFFPTVFVAQAAVTRLYRILRHCKEAKPDARSDREWKKLAGVVVGFSDIF